jgi:undecaprenyl diphosphate synthase
MGNNFSEKVLDHLAIILDGNGRWAKKRGLPRLLGHKAGVATAEKIVRAVSDRGIKYLSLYAFSTENWKRPEKEVAGLMLIFKHVLRRKVKKLHEENVRLRFSGFKKGFSKEINQLMQWAEDETSGNTRFNLVICLNYGGRQEILHAVEKLYKDGVVPPYKEEDIQNNLYLPDIPDPDLIIRTGGEQRLSNFWLWQNAYSELIFTDVLWPDYNEEHLDNALSEYASRQRRYGGLSGI